MERQGLYGKSLYLPLGFVSNLKILLKNKVLKIVLNCNTAVMYKMQSKVTLDPLHLILRGAFDHMSSF